MTGTIRFDKPVSVMYEPIFETVTGNPMNYLSAASGALDIISKDRLHCAFRVESKESKT